MCIMVALTFEGEADCSLQVLDSFIGMPGWFVAPAVQLFDQCVDGVPPSVSQVEEKCQQEKTESQDQGHCFRLCLK